MSSYVHPEPPPPASSDTRLRTEALRLAIDVHRLAAEQRRPPSAPIRDLAEDYFRWLKTGQWS